MKRTFEFIDRLIEVRNAFAGSPESKEFDDLIVQNLKKMKRRYVKSKDSANIQRCNDLLEKPWLREESLISSNILRDDDDHGFYDNLSRSEHPDDMQYSAEGGKSRKHRKRGRKHSRTSRKHLKD
jgi:hypothetical protein